MNRVSDFFGQGTRRDGSLYGWPGCKAVHPMTGDVGIFGAEPWTNAMRTEVEAAYILATAIDGVIEIDTAADPEVNLGTPRTYAWAAAAAASPDPGATDDDAFLATVVGHLHDIPEGAVLVAENNGNRIIFLDDEGVEYLLKKQTADDVDCEENRRVDNILAVEPPSTTSGANLAWKWISKDC